MLLVAGGAALPPGGRYCSAWSSDKRGCCPAGSRPRMLIAQAKCANLTLVTRDANCQKYEVDVLAV